MVDYYRPILCITPLKTAGERCFSLSVGFFLQWEGFSFLLSSWEIKAGGAEPDAQGFFLFTFCLSASDRSGLSRELRRIHLATIFGLC